MVIVLIAFQSGPMQLLAAVKDVAKAKTVSSGFVGNPLPVDFERGTLMLQLEDLSFKNDVLPLNLTRYYRSDLDLNSQSIFGDRWYCVLDMRIKVKGETLGLIDEQARERIYKRNPKGVFISQKWEYEELYRVKSKGVEGYERKLKNGVSYLFDATPEHRLIEIKDRNGRFLKIDRVTAKGAITIKDRYGRWIKVTLKDGYADSAVDSMNRVMKYEYDQVNGNLSTVTTHSGGRYQLYYDGKGQMSRINIGANRWYSFKYKKGLLSEQRSNAGLIAEYIYKKTKDGLLVTITDAVKCRKSMAYKTGGSVIITEPDGSVSRLERNGRLLPVKSTMASGESQEFVYDARFNAIRITDSGAVIDYKYDQLDLINEIQVPTGEVYKMEYDSKGNLIVVTDAWDASILLEWNSLGQITMINQPDGQKMELSYDENGLPESIKDSVSGKFNLSFSVDGLIKEFESPTGVKTSIRYNASGLPSFVENSEGQLIDLSHDEYGNLTRVRDALDNSCSYHYDAMGMVVKAEDQLGGSIDLTWRKDGSIATFSDAKDNKTSWEYDKSGRMGSETDASGSVRKTGYDAAGRRSEYINARGQTIKVGYDMFGRVNSLLSDSDKSLYEYDAAGRMVMMKNANTEYNQSFGTNGEVQGYTDVLLSKSVSYKYDSIGRRSSMTTPDGIVAYTYDAVGRIETIKKNGMSVVFAYDAFGRRSKMSYSNGTVTSYVYDNLNRLIGIKVVDKSGKILTSVEYGYDKLSRVVSTVDEKGVSKKYEYDPKGQLVKVTQGSTVTEYEYDLVGNRKAVISDGERVEYKTGPNNQLLEAGGDTFKYDADGNLISKSSADGKNYTYAYDEVNQMISAQGPDGRVAYKYSPNGIKVARKFEDKELRYLYDGNDIISEICDGKTEAEYLHGPGVDEWLMVERGGSQFSCHADRLGSVIAHSDKSGKIVKSFSFDEFGLPDKESRGINSLTSFTGREWDPVAAMHYYRARFYSPETGRFNSLDPMGLTQGVNQYSYVYNSPLNFRDPSGCFIFTTTILGVMAVGALVGGAFTAYNGGDKWAIASSMGIGALSPIAIAIGIKAAFGYAIGITVAEYLARIGFNPWKFEWRKFFSTIGNGIGSLIFNVITGLGIGKLLRGVGPWIRNTLFRGLRNVFHPRTIIRISRAAFETVKNTVGGVLDNGWEWLKKKVSPGSGGDATGTGGAGSGGDNEEYKRFDRFEGWSTMNWSAVRECAIV